MPRPRILVVDDHPDIVEYFLFYLRQKGFRLAWAYDGVTALALAKVTKPDLVLLNIQMPRIDGVQVLRELREDPRTRDMKVILMSGLIHVRELAKENGAQDYLEYPPRTEDVGVKVDRVLAA